MTRVRILTLAFALSACSAPTDTAMDPQSPVSGDTSSSSIPKSPPEITSRNAVRHHLGEDWQEVTSENYGNQMSARSHAYDELEFKPISLEGVECGDNCYLLYFPKIEGGGDATALCSAPICEEWFAAQVLPEDMRQRGALAKFGSGMQVDGAGTVMDADYPMITAMRLDPK